MLAHPDFDTYPHKTVPPSRRWVAVLAAVVLLHLIVLGWAEEGMAVPNPDHPNKEDAPPVALVQLQAPDLQPSITAPRPKHKPEPRIPAITHPAHPVATPESGLVPPVAVAAAPDPNLSDSTALAQTQQDTATNAQSDTLDGKRAAASAEPATIAPENKTETDDVTLPQEKALSDSPYKIDLPPPAELKYDVQKVSVDGEKFYGSGSITWQHENDNYRIEGEGHLLFLTLFTFKSEGLLNDYGLAPVLFSQKSMGRSETATHFNRDVRNNISFSASTVSYPIKGGEQDRYSFLWQLAGIARGDREKFLPGAQIDIFVAGVRDGDTWSNIVAGQEDIAIGDAKTLAWHVVRIPRAGTYDQKYDIWLAPQYQWLPVKIRITEKNGNYLELTMSAFHQLPVASQRAESAQ